MQAEQQIGADSPLRAELDSRPMSTYQWLVVVLCMVLNMIDGFDVLVMAFTASHVAKEWQLAGAQLGLLLSAGLFGMAGGSLLIAPQADRWGRRPVILLCLALSATGMLLSSVSSSPLQLGAFRVLTGVGVGGILACSNVIAAEYASRRWRGLAVSLQSTGYALGAALGGAIAMWLLGAHGWRSVFAGGGVATAAVALLVLWRLPESLDFLMTRERTDKVAKASAAILAKLAARSPMPDQRHVPQGIKRGGSVAGLLAAHQRRTTFSVWGAFFFTMFGYFFVMSWTPKLLATAGLSVEQGVTAGVLLSAGGVFGTALLGLATARFRLTSVVAAFLLTTGALLTAFKFGGLQVTGYFALALAIGVFANGCVAGLYAVGASSYASEQRVTGLGWGIGVGRVGAILSPLVAGRLIDAQWAPDQLYVSCSLLFLAAAVAVAAHPSRGATSESGLASARPASS